LGNNDIMNMGFHTINEYPDILTPELIGEYLQLKRSTLYQTINQPDFPSFRVGKLIRVKKGDLLQWIDSRKVDKN
jgi:excisionase family DNA binding protein